MNSLSNPRTDLGEERRRGREFVPKFVPNSLKSGHELVDKIGSIQLQGIIIDRNWLKHSLFQNDEGKPNLTAILVYGDLVDWYRPLKKRDPIDHGRTFAEKKFKGDYLVKIYARWADSIGLTKGQVQDAVYFLERRNLVEYRTASPEIRKAWSDPEHGNEKPFEIWPVAKMVKQVSSCESIPERLDSHYKTGNSVCDELFPVRLRGDVIDFNWLSHPSLRQGVKSKLNIPALFVFANLFFLHTPRTRVDRVTHEILQSGKWFKHDVLSKDYGSWEKASGLTDTQLRKAVAFLANQKLVDRWTGTETTSEGYESNLRAMIQLRFDDVFDLTFGPFSSETDRIIAQRGDAKLRPKKVETPQQLSINDLRTAPEKSGDPLSDSLSAESTPENDEGQHPKKAETSSRKKQTTIGTIPVSPSVTTEIQQQQQNVNDPPASFGGGGLAAKASNHSATEIPLEEAQLRERRQVVIRRLLSFESGCASKTIELAAALRLEHAEMWAEHWTNEPESMEEFWDKRWRENPTAAQSNPGAALAKRLNDTAQIPKSVRAERKKERNRIAIAYQEKRDEEKLREAIEQRAKDDEFAYQRKNAADTMRRFAAYPDAVRRAAIAKVIQMNDFLADKNVAKLVDQALAGKLNDEPLLFTLAGELSGALDSVTQAQPALPTMEQRAPGDGGEDEDEDWDEDELPPVDRATMMEQIREGTGARWLIDDMVERINEGALAVENLDRARSNLFELKEWEIIKERVLFECGLSNRPDAPESETPSP